MQVDTSCDYNLFDNIPPELQALPQWVVWKYQDNGKPKLDKMPYSPRMGKLASVSNSQTWGAYEEAVTAYLLAATMASVLCSP